MASRVYLEQLGELIGDTWTPQDAVAITASVETELDAVIEAPIPTNESTGWYYVVLRALYHADKHADCSSGNP